MLINKNNFNNSSIFKQLEIFVKIIETQSFSEAANKVNLTPSAVSQSFARLEKQVGVTLIKRTTRNINLTEAGHFLFDEAKKLLVLLDESLLNTSSFKEQAKGQLKVTCSFAFGTCHLTSLFSEYQQLYPNVNLLVDLNDKLISLNEENFDIALRITDEPPENYSMRKICTINWAYCASPQYLARKSEPKSILDLKSHDCLVYPEMSDAWKYKDKEGGIFDIKIEKKIQANSSLFLLNVALNHQGIVCLPTYVMSDYIRSNQLKLILPNEYPNENPYYLYVLYFPSCYQDKKVRNFIDFIVTKLSPVAPWDKNIGLNQAKY